jgi:hypothetical protein
MRWRLNLRDECNWIWSSGFERPTGSSGFTRLYTYRGIVFDYGPYLEIQTQTDRPHEANSRTEFGGQTGLVLRG